MKSKKFERTKKTNCSCKKINNQQICDLSCEQNGPNQEYSKNPSFNYQFWKPYILDIKSLYGKKIKYYNLVKSLEDKKELVCTFNEEYNQINEQGISNGNKFKEPDLDGQSEISNRLRNIEKIDSELESNQSNQMSELLSKFLGGKESVNQPSEEQIETGNIVKINNKPSIVEAQSLYNRVEKKAPKPRNFSEIKIKLLWQIYNCGNQNYFLRNRNTKIHKISNYFQIKKYNIANSEHIMTNIQQNHTYNLRKLKSIVYNNCKLHFDLTISEIKWLKYLNIYNSYFNQNLIKYSLNLKELKLNKCSINSLNLPINQNLMKLKKLDLSRNDLGVHGLSYFEKWNIPQLKTLDLSSNSLYTVGLKYIEKWNVNQLKTLILRENKFGITGLKYIEGWFCIQLKNLDLSTNDLGAEGLKFISKWNFNNLKTLDLSRNNLKGDKLKHVGKWNLIQLKSLDLSSNNLGKDGLMHFAKWNFIGLESLNLSMNNFGNIGLKHIENWNCKKLKKLILFGADLGIDGLKHIEKWNCSELRTLVLKINNLGFDGLKYIQKWSFNRLKTLNLSSNNFSGLGLRFIEKWDLSKLMMLDLSKNNLTVESLRYFEKMNLKKLKTLDLRENKLSIDGLKYIEEWKVENIYQ